MSTALKLDINHFPWNKIFQDHHLLIIISKNKQKKILLCISSMLTEEHEIWKSRNIWSLDKKNVPPPLQLQPSNQYIFFLPHSFHIFNFFPFQIIHQNGKILFFLSIITAWSCRHTRSFPIGNKCIEITILLASYPTVRMKN